MGLVVLSNRELQVFESHAINLKEINKTCGKLSKGQQVSMNFTQSQSENFLYIKILTKRNAAIVKVCQFCKNSIIKNQLSTRKKQHENFAVASKKKFV